LDTYTRLSVAAPEDVQQIERRLRAAFGISLRFVADDPVEELVSTVLSQHTAGPNSDRALAALRRRFPTWAAVAGADTHEVAAAIRCAGLANQKAPRLQGMLRRLHDERGSFDLGFLREPPIDAAMAWLQRLPGVGQTTAACVLLFGLGRPAMPVDTGIARVAGRLGLVPPGAPAEAIQAVLQEGVAADDVHTLHVNLIHHAREICRPSGPRCEVCPLNDLCASFNRSRARWSGAPGVPAKAS
jgi:endonuclease-3